MLLTETRPSVGPGTVGLPTRLHVHTAGLTHNQRGNHKAGRVQAAPSFIILSLLSQKTRTAPSLPLWSSHPIKMAIYVVRKALESPGHHPYDPVSTLC